MSNGYEQQIMTSGKNRRPCFIHNSFYCRVLRPPGGQSSNIFGNDPTPQQQAARSVQQEQRQQQQQQQQQQPSNPHQDARDAYQRNKPNQKGELKYYLL